MVLLLRSPACSSMSCAHLRFHLRTVFFFVQASFSFYSHVCVCALHRPLFETNAWKKRELLCAERPLLRAILCFFFFYCNYYLAGNRERKVENYRKVLSCRDS